MRISQRGLDLIVEFEGFPANGAPYRDPVGIWTIGFGTTRINGRAVTSSTPRLKKSAALALLRRQLDERYEPPVRSVAKRLGLNQHEYDALVSFAYNLGPGAVEGVRGFETMGRALSSGSRRRIADAFLLYDKAGGRALAGLTRRRRAERELFLTPTPATTAGEADPRYRLLTDGERKHVNELLRRRRVKYRNGGRWARVPWHHARAIAASAWLAARLATIAVGQGPNGNRAKRRAYLRLVLRSGSMQRP
ncbi:MAG: lysozyme [Solirubrobacteraceae bacterium]|nr:lysozyme [Solirubrobacteraceae bacterium]